MSQHQTPSPFVGQYPFQDATASMPPVCLKTHWDPTQILKRVLPQQQVALPEDFRPWVRVCKNYVTSAPAREAPMPPKDMVFPTGGGFYPPGRYTAAIDKESSLRTLDQPLDDWCEKGRYVPKLSSTLYNSGSTLPDRKTTMSAFVSELAMPKALLRADEHSCRTENDTAYFAKSGRLFNNPTKQDRYGAQKYYALRDGLPKGEPMPHGGVPMVPPTFQAAVGKHGANIFQQPGGTNVTVAQAAANAQAYKKNANDASIRNGTSFRGIATGGSSAPVW